MFGYLKNLVTVQRPIAITLNFYQSHIGKNMHILSFKLVNRFSDIDKRQFVTPKVVDQLKHLEYVILIGNQI